MLAVPLIAASGDCREMHNGGPKLARDGRMASAALSPDLIRGFARPFGVEMIHSIISKTPFTPIEMAFSKLKATIKKAAACTDEEVWQAVGLVSDYSQTRNVYIFFRAAG